MLILSRHENERIIINGGQITIQVIDIVGNRVRLGIEAPPDVTIHREEVQKLVDLEKEDLT